MEKQKDLFIGDIMIKGKHATYAKFLCSTTEKKEIKYDRKPADVFERIIDVYMVGAVIGIARGIMVEEDKSSSDQARIFAEAVNREKLNLEFIYQLVMLVDNSQKLSADAKITRAFKNEDIKANVDLFNAYVRGGIEWLYEQFTTGASTHDDYIDKIYEIVESYKEECFL